MLQLVGRAALVTGFACVAGWSVVYLDGVHGKRRLMDQFTALQAAAPPQADVPDQSLWSQQRIVAWRNAVKEHSAPPLAVLRIPRIGLEVPIVEGTDDLSLNRAVGHIEDTAMPGRDGNLGIAGHRDGFFRGLKDIQLGDAIEVETLQTTAVYHIERIWIVDPEDVSVIEPTTERSVTLVTCYPFYFIGSAPRRFIVRAAFAENRPPSVRTRR